MNEKENVNNTPNVKARIYNLIIVDESGSMTSLREASLDGINETIETIRSAQEKYADTQEQFLTLVTFDDGAGRPIVRTMIDNLPIKDVGKFEDYHPYGCTPLLDAVGQSLTRLHTRIKDDEDATAVVTILTDGMENCSREWTFRNLCRLIEQLKEEGWSFSYMGSTHDVKEVTRRLSIDNIVEFAHDKIGSKNTWKRESSSRDSYYSKMDFLYRQHPEMSAMGKLRHKVQFSRSYYSQRITPERITHLEDNEIFVFGSNINGYHGGGAAAFAMRHFGAVWGQGEGLQGRSYAIPTMEGLDNMRKAVRRFISFADQHREIRFLVTAIGCGIAGYSVSEVAPLFIDCIKLENVALPESFWRALGLSMDK